MAVGANSSQSVYGSGAYPQRGGATRTFISELWSGMYVTKFYEACVAAAICNTNYEGLISKQGDKVIIHQVPDVTISDYEKGDEIAYQDLNAANVELEIDYAKLFAFKVDKIDKLQANKQFMDKCTTDGSEKMKIAIDAHILATIPSQVAAANAGATAGLKSQDIDLGTALAPIVVDKNNILDLIVDLGTVLDEQSVPETSRKLVLPARICGLIKKSDIKNASITGDGTSAMRNGRIGEIDRFEIFSSNNLVKTNNVWDLLAAHPSATTFAAQFVDVEYLEKLERTFGSAIRGLNVYGFKVEQPKGLALAKVTLA